MVYKWVTGGARFNVDAQAAGEEVERLSRENGGTITAENVVGSAESESSPLHNAFEWDDGLAAKEYRLVQARCLMRSITVIRQDADEEEEKTIRAFVHTDTEKAYTSVHRAMSDEELRAEVLKKAWRELQTWRRKYEDLREFSAVISAAQGVKIA